MNTSCEGQDIRFVAGGKRESSSVGCLVPPKDLTTRDGEEEQRGLEFSDSEVDLNGEAELRVNDQHRMLVTRIIPNL